MANPMSSLGPDLTTANTTWNPSDKTANCTLTGANLIATATSANAGARSVYGQSSGKHYWEYTISGTITGSATAPGIANSTANLTSFGSSAMNACFVYNSGQIWFNGSGTGLTLGAVSTGTVIGVALDMDTLRLWFRQSPSGNWNGSGTANPATGVGGINISAAFNSSTNQAYAAVALNYTNDAITANFGDSSFAGAIPSGFAGGLSPPSSSAPAGVVLTPQGDVVAMSYNVTQDYPRLVYSAPRFEVVAIADIIEPSVMEAVQGMLPTLVPPYVTAAANAAVQALAVQLVGSTMTGPLMLSPTMPTAPSMAASMAYVQSMIATVVPEVPPVPANQAWARETGQWVPIAGGGTVTNIATGAGLTGGPITATGTIAMANMAANSLKGNNTAGVAPPTDIPAGTVLAMIGAAPLASPVFTGTPVLPTGTTGVTQAPAVNNTTLATTAYVTAAIAAAPVGVQSFNTRTGAVTLTLPDVTGVGGAPLAGPNFSGVPTAPTAAGGTSNAQLANTAFVAAALSSYLPLTGGTISGNLSVNGGLGIQYSTFTGGGADGGAHWFRFGWSGARLVADVDAVAAVPIANVSDLGNYLPLSGGTLTGTLIVNGTASALNVGGQSNTSAFTVQGGATFGTANLGAVVNNHGTFVSEVAAPGGAFCCLDSAGPTACGIYLSNVLPVLATAQMTGTGAPITNWQFFQSGGMYPSNNNVQVCGLASNAWSSVASYAFAQESDPRLKKDVVAATAGALAHVLTIPVQNFRWNEEDESAPLHTGWMATDVQAAFGELAVVIEGGDEAKTLALNTSEMTAILWQAVQELAAEVSAKS